MSRGPVLVNPELIALLADDLIALAGGARPFPKRWRRLRFSIAGCRTLRRVLPLWYGRRSPPSGQSPSHRDLPDLRH
jgi:hypothetical protein